MKELQTKTLYFEEVGAVSKESNGLSCRIRTAFHNDEGKMIYLELTCSQPNYIQLYNAKRQGYTLPKTYIHVAYAHYITDDADIDDCNKSKISNFLCDWSYRNLPDQVYTLENIKNVVNNVFGCSFDGVCIPDRLAGYRVFSQEKTEGYETSKNFNFGDEFFYDESLTNKRIAKVGELKEHFKKLFNQCFDNTRYWAEDGKLMVKLNVSAEKRLNAGYQERIFSVPV